MTGFMEQCIQLYVMLVDTPLFKVKLEQTPSLEDRNLSDQDFELTIILYDTHLPRLYLLHPVTSQARNMILWGIVVVHALARIYAEQGTSRGWARACDKKLSRLMWYIPSALDMGLLSHTGDPTPECLLLLFTDPGYAGHARTSKPSHGRTDGRGLKGEAVVSHSSSGADHNRDGVHVECRRASNVVS